MKKQFFSIFLVCVFFLTFISGCNEKKIPELAESETPPAAASYKTMKLGADGGLEIARKDIGNTPMGEAGTWTIFVYMSGSNLESAQSSGTYDLKEMAAVLNSESGENAGNIRFVVQTGGAEEWRHGDISAKTLQRHVVSNGELETVAQLPLASMGEAATLRNFVRWGVENYPAEKMGLVLWGHGLGSLGGVCKDDIFDGDYLELSEINSALSEASEVMTDKFEFIGSDACYMATLEMADICASYARYMIGSEELEPADGWNYTALGDFLANEPNADWDKISETICESFLTASEKSEHASRVTLSVIELSKIDDLLVKLNDFSRDLCGNLTTREQLRVFKKTLEAGEHFGNGTICDGFSNNADLHDLISAGNVFASTSEIEKALESAVIRKSNGGGHPTASGLTVFFPFEACGTEDLRAVAGFAPCPFYIEFIETMMLSASPAFDYTKLKIGEAAALCVGETGVNTALCEHWRGLGESASGGSISALVKTAGNFSITSDGKYNFSITPETLRFAKNVGLRVSRNRHHKEGEADEDEFVAYGKMLCQTADWEDGSFSGEFNGIWIMWPNREPISIIPYERAAGGVTYVAEVRIAKEPKAINVFANNFGNVYLGGYYSYGDDGKYTLEKIEDGSTCISFHSLHTYDSAEKGTALGNKMVFDGEARVIRDMLQDGDYYCFLEITDVYGDTVRSPIRDFTITNGEVNFK